MADSFIQRAPNFAAAPHPRTAEGAQERVRMMLRFITSHLRAAYLLEGGSSSPSYLDRASNRLAFVVDRSRTEWNESLYCWLTLFDVAELEKRFGDLPEDVATLRKNMIALDEQAGPIRAQRNVWRQKIKYSLVGFALGGVVVTGTPALLSVAGFTTSGITGGSIAAGAQSYFYGGFTSGVFSALQSAGAAGISITTQAGIIGGGTTLGAVMGARADGTNAGGDVERAVHPSTFSWERGDLAANIGDLDKIVSKLQTDTTTTTTTTGNDAQAQDNHL